ncbi:MAG: WecB/TagA/CpsF family glycosyltransferase [Candidatus Shapirobacteria bacterium]
MNKTIDIFGIKLSTRSFKESIQWIEKRGQSGKATVVYCCTLNEIQMSEKDVLFKKMFDKADLVTADGMPLVWGIRLRTGKGERVYGPDLMREMIYKNKENHIFVGDKKNEKYFEKIGSYVVMPMMEKFTEKNYQSLTKKIKKMKGVIVWLGLGSRKQVEVAYELKKRGVNKVMITVGAAFDFLSGNKKQAPKWLRNMGGEWLFRLLNEPKRLIKRYLEIALFLGRRLLS